MRPTSASPSSGTSSRASAGPTRPSRRPASCRSDPSGRTVALPSVVVTGCAVPSRDRIDRLLRAVIPRQTGLFTLQMDRLPLPQRSGELPRQDDFTFHHEDDLFVTLARLQFPPFFSGGENAVDQVAGVTPRFVISEDVLSRALDPAGDVEYLHKSPPVTWNGLPEKRSDAAAGACRMHRGQVPVPGGSGARTVSAALFIRRGFWYHGSSGMGERNGRHGRSGNAKSLGTSGSARDRRGLQVRGSALRYRDGPLHC